MSERWHRLKSVFQAALDEDETRRSAFLDAECGADTDLRRQVEVLLSSYQQAPSFLETPAMGRLPDAPSGPGWLEGHRIGPYEIGTLVGEGGMGIVYQAARVDDVFRKRVAIKVVKRGMDTGSVLRRFQHERQTLASLDHPGIAKILDGGTTAEGLPYFVMEFVEGEPLDVYCDRQTLGIVERLKLFRPICAAIQYAHQNLVVHRDIKPDNILVTSDGQPKLVDFGIAKVLDPAATFQTQELTSGPQRLLTYEYASPEQVRGAPITTATDVYSLGVVLYELLAGRLPHDLRGRPSSEFERIICEEEPAKPSAVKAIGRDLDMIVLKAIHKEPARRYATVEQLAEDIRRYLDGLPVLALPDTLAYRTRKFVTRHRIEVAAAAFILISLTAGVVATVWQAREARIERARAENRFNDVRALANAVVFEMHDAIARVPGSTPVRQLLVTRALEYLASLARDTPSDPALLRELSAAYRKIGDVQGNPYEANLGDPAGAMDSYRRALALLDSLPDAESRRETQREIASVHERIGDIKAITGDVAGALDSQREALALRQTLGGTGASDQQAGELADSHKKVAESLLWKGESALALTHAREGLRLREAIAPDRPTAAGQAALASSLTNVGEMLVASGDGPSALEHFRKAVAIATSASEREPTSPPLRRQRAIALSKIGEMLTGAGDLAGAAASHRAALATRRELTTADPANTQARRDLAISHIMVAETLQAGRDRREALEQVQESLTIFERLAAEGNASARTDLAEAHRMAGAIRLRVGDTAAAITSFERAIALAEAVTAGDAADVDTRRGIVNSYRRLGDAHAAAARAADASPATRLARWQDARRSYQMAHDLLLSIRKVIELTADDEGQIVATAQRIAASDEAVSRLNAGRDAQAAR